MLNSDNFEQMLEDSLKQNNLPEKGSITETTVLQITSEVVIVDVSAKTEASINKKEFLELPKVGDKVRVYVEDINNSYIKLSHAKVLKQENMQVLREAYESKELVKGTIKKAVPKGFLVNLLGWEAFLPYSQATPSRGEIKEDEKKAMLNKSYSFSVISLEEKGINLKLIVSLRHQMENSRNENKEKFLQTLSNGDIISGKVILLKEKSVLIEIAPDCVGLVRGSDVSWDKIATPSVLLKLGDVVSVKVLEINMEKLQVLLSIKDAKGNIWEKFAEKHPIFTPIEGKVEFVEPTYLVLKVQEGIQGILHISNISWDKTIANMQDMYKPGQKVNVMITRLEPENRKIDFGVKQLENNPWDVFAEKHPVGSTAEGIIVRKNQFALFVELDKVTGMLHRNDLSWNPLDQNLDHYSVGNKITVTVAEVDQNRQRLSLTLKTMDINPWSDFQKTQVGDRLKAHIKDITPSGILLSFPGGLELLMHESQVPREINLQPNEDVEVLVTDINPRKFFLRVSMRALQHKEEKENLAQYMNTQEDSGESDDAMLGNILSDFFNKKSK